MPYYRRKYPKSMVVHKHTDCVKAKAFIEAGNFTETAEKPKRCTVADCCQAIDRRLKREAQHAVKA